MDRNTITGLVLIGLILTVFSIINRPSEEDIKEQQKKELAKTEKIKADKNKATVNDSIVQDTTVTDQPIMTDATEMISDTVEPTVKQVVRDTVIVKETDKFIIHFSSIGGQMEFWSVELNVNNSTVKMLLAYEFQFPQRKIILNENS